jgi:fused signal recognition particle receptor
MVLKYIRRSYQKVKQALSKGGSLLGTRIRTLFQGKIDESSLDQLEQLLYEADLGVQLAGDLRKKISDLYLKNPKLTPEDLLSAIKKEILAILSTQDTKLIDIPKNEGPLVILIVGVNGNGKTTSVAKLSKCLIDENKKVLIAAADTFRAAAIAQLETWAERLNTDIVKGVPNCDPSAVVFDALTAAKAREADVLLIDTAGRLHTKTHLMQELEKIKRTCQKLSPKAPHETLLVLDATTGQNAIDQAKTFHKFTPITGLILTKLDGTAKGGIAINIQKQLGIPIKFIGVGESIEDLEHFDSVSFVNTLFD